MANKAKKAKDAAFVIRMSDEMHDAMVRAVETSNTMHGQYDEQSVSSVIRQLCVDYIERIKVIAESEASKHAAKVLKGARRAG